MDESKINKFVMKIAKDLMYARPSIPLSVAVGVANYKMANICSHLNITINTRSGYSDTPANIYQLCLLPSGAGKGASLTLADNFYFGEAFDYITKEVYPKFKERAELKLEQQGVERVLHNLVKSNSDITYSGLFAYAESYSLSKFGGINIEIDEIGDAVTSKAELFGILLQPYDNGILDPVGKRTDPNAISISGLNINMYCFGNKVRLSEGDNVEVSFRKLLDEGYGRRMIFIDDVSTMRERTAQEYRDEMLASDKIKANRKEDREFIKSLVKTENLGKVLKLSDDAMLDFATIKCEGDNYVINNRGLHPAVVSDMTERVFKTSKLAGIYAFFEGYDEIQSRHMQEAFEVIKESSRVLFELRKSKSLHHRLLDKLLEEDKAVTAQHCLTYPFIPSSWTKKIIEILDLSKQLASEKGLVWSETKNKGVIYFSVTEKNSKDKEIVSDELESIEEDDGLTDEEKQLLKLLYE